MTTVTVELTDLVALAELISDRDTRTMPPTLENIEQCHSLIIKMMGLHASAYFVPDDDDHD